MTIFEKIKATNEAKLRKLLYVRWRDAKKRVEDSGREFDLTVDMLIEIFHEQNKCCYYTHVPLTIITNTPFTISIDRKDPRIGYTRENTVITGTYVNIVKFLKSESDFLSSLMFFSYQVIEHNMHIEKFRKQSIKFAHHIIEKYDN